MCQKSNTKQKVNEPLEKGNYHQVTLIMNFVQKKKKIISNRSRSNFSLLETGVICVEEILLFKVFE